jgi:translation elongation factor EF-1beta
MAEKKKTSAGAQTPPNQKSLSENLKELAEISAWFSGQEDLDVEAGLEKVKTAAALIKSSKDKLDKLENEFKEIEKDFSVSPEDSVQQ